MISKAWDQYAEQASRPLPDADVQPQSKEVPSVQELRSMLSGSPAEEGEDLDIIAQKNLFTPKRQAWQPPQKKKTAQKDNEQDKDQSQARAVERAREIPRSKIRLYGTTITDSTKTALVYMEPFQAKDKYFRVQEGEILRDEGERGEWLYFKLASVTSDSVTLEDPGGESFDVGLYDHQREHKKTASRDTSGIQITVGGEQVSPDSDQEGQAEAGGKGAEGSETGQKAGQDATSTSEGPDGEPSTGDGSDAEQGSDDTENAQDKGGPQGLVEALKNLRDQRDKGSGESMSAEEREQQVEEGNMRKIETPFGTIYRPAN